MKKILALVLSAIVLLSFFTVPSMAETEKSDLDFVRAMGFIKADEDAELDPTEYVSRIALAEIFYNIVFENIDSGMAVGKTFSDVPAEKQHFASTVYGMGVMRGYSEDVFAPDDIVTYNQAIKAIVSFLGYDLLAQNMGGYPSGYLSQATRLQILPGGNISGDAKATFGGIATILKKAVGVDVAIWNHSNAEGKAVLDILEGVDYLEYYCGIENAHGMVTGNYLTDLQSGESTSFFGIYLDSEYFSVDIGAHGIQDLLGYNVYVFYKNIGGNKVAIYYETGRSKEVKISAREISYITQGEIKYFDGESDFVQSADFDVNAPLIYNGTYESTYPVSYLNPFADSKYDGSIKLIDANFDGIYDVVVVSAYEVMVVNEVKDNKIYGKYSNCDKVLDITNYRERNINIRDITGALMTPEGIKKGDVLNVAKDKNGAVKEIIASKDYMTGVIEEISYVGSKISAVKMAGTVFNTTNGLVVIDPSNKLAPGSTANVFFSCEAEIALIDAESNYKTGYETGYVVDAATEGGLNQSVLCMIFTSEGEMKTYSVSKKVLINGEACEGAEFLTKLGTEGTRAKRQAVLYKTDLEGNVLTAVEIAPQISDAQYAFNGFYRLPGEEINYSGGMGSFDNKYLLGDNVVVFGVPDEKDRDNYDGYKISKLEYGEDSKATASEIYGSRADALMVDVVVMSNKNVSGTAGADKRPLFVVSKVSTVIDDEGETRMRVSGVYVERTAIKTGSFLINPELFTTGHDIGNAADANNGKRPFIDQSKTAPEPGDIYRVSTFSTTGEIEYMNVKEFFQLYDYKTKKIAASSGLMTDTVGGGGTYAIGTVDVKEGGAVRLLRPDNEVMAFNLSAGSYKYIELTKNNQTGEAVVKTATETSIVSEQLQPGNGSQLLLYYRGTGIACIILNDK